jgi:hypothetical protein
MLENMLPFHYTEERALVLSRKEAAVAKVSKNMNRTFFDFRIIWPVTGISTGTVR